VSTGGSSVLEEIEHCFKSYNAFEERPFKILGSGGPAAAERLLKAGRKRASQ
jgi:inorganic pyrophosphatase